MRRPELLSKEYFQLQSHTIELKDFYELKSERSESSRLINQSQKNNASSGHDTKTT